MKRYAILLLMGVILFSLTAIPASAGDNAWSGNGPFASEEGSRVITALAVSSDGRILYAGAGSGTVYRYDLISPTVSTGAATGLSAQGVVLNGTVNAHNAQTTVYFEFGATPDYGNVLAASPGSVNGDEDTAVSANLSGLAPNIVYHYRLVASNSSGETRGQDATFTFDTMPPVTTLNAKPANLTFETSAVFAFTANEASSFECEIDGSGFISACTSPKTYTGLSEGPHTFSVRATDQAGNVETQPVTYAWSVDVTKPAVTVVFTGGSVTSGKTVTMSISASDANRLSGMMFSWDEGVTWTAEEPFLTTKTWQLEGGDGLKTVWVKLRDGAGNWSDRVVTTITLDTTAPVTTATPSGGVYSAAQNVTLQTNESATIHYTTDGADPSSSSPVYNGTPIPVAQTTVLKFFAIDSAGNVEPPRTETYTLAYSLLITKTGTGEGTVKSLSTGIDCGNVCTETYPFVTAITLTAVPQSGSVFSGWNGGGCSGTGNCTVSVNNALTVTAAFSAYLRANPGPSQMVYNKATLDGSASEGHLVSWNWRLTHQTNPDLNRTAVGEKPTLTNLQEGFYQVALTVTDIHGASDTANTTLAVAPNSLVNEIRTGWYDQAHLDQSVASANAAKDTIIAQKDQTIATLNATVTAKDQTIASLFTQQQLDQAVANANAAKDTVIEQKDQTIATLNTTVAAKDQIIASLFTQQQIDQAVTEERRKWDVNDDGKMGMPEVIYILQRMAGMR